MGDAKCERCGRGTDINRRYDFCSEATIRPLGVTSSLGERECAAITRVRAPLDAEVARLTAEVATLRAKLDDAVTPRRKFEWYEEIGPVLWWCFPVNEPPYSGTPLDDDFPDYVTHWTPVVVPTEHTTREGAEETKR